MPRVRMLRGHTGRLMSAQTSGGFRAGCREQAGLALVAFGHFWSRYAPGGRNRILLRTGCLIVAERDGDGRLRRIVMFHGPLPAVG
jgi:hypothetical protein